MATEKDIALAQDLLVQQISLFRFSAHERGRVLAILKRMEEDLIADLLDKKLTDLGRADRARLLRQAQAVIEDYYGKASDTMAQSMAELGRVEAGATAKAIGSAFQGHIEPALPPEVYFRKLVDGTLIQGAPSAAWWEKQAGDVAFRFQTELAQGLAQGETNDQLIRRIRGSAVGYKVVEGKRVYEYAGGVMQTSRANAAALVQTSTQAAAASARRATFQANDDVVKGIRQVSTLDGHTSLTCVAYSGASWNMQYSPILPTTLPYNGGVPRHWNCRSVETAITKTFRELGIDIPEFAPTSRSASGGPLSAKIEFGEFLDKKGPAFTGDLLGAGRAQLWKDGKITLQQLLDQSGRPLSVAELRKRYDQ